MVAQTDPALYMVLCADNQKCWWPGYLGSTWEDLPTPPYLTPDEAAEVVKDLDAPTHRRADGVEVALDPAPCGPHRVQKFVPAE